MKVEVCRHCEGHGEFVIAGSHRHEDSHIKTCTECNGTGRVKTKSFSIQIPYDFDMTEFCRAEKIILEQISSLKKNTENEE
jgi:hypothetical protein